MTISGSLIRLLKGAVLGTHNEGEFRQFTTFHAEEFMVDYDNDTSTGKAYTDRLFEYIELLRKRNTIIPFITIYLSELLPEQKKQKEEVINFTSAFEKIYSKDDNDRWIISRQHFRCLMIQNSLPFVDRDIVKEKLYDMIGREGGARMLLIDGERGSGLSYIRWILNQVGAQTRCFEFIPIDVKRELKPYALEGLISSAHMAQYLADRLQMNYSAENFKINPFKSRLKSFLDTRETACLFYLHQFDVAVADDFHDFIHALLELVVEQNANYYVVVSGYPKSSTLPFEWTVIRPPVNIGHGTLSRNHVLDFYRDYYDVLRSKKPINFTVEDFLQKIDSQLPQDPFAPENKSNVIPVAKMLTDWFEKNNA